MQNSKAQKKGWSEAESNLLAEIVLNSKTDKWAKIAEEFNEKSPFGVIRLSKHCREKWNNHLNPKIKKLEKRKLNGLLLKNQ